MPRTKTHRVSPSISPELIADVAQMFLDQTIEREKSRRAVFDRAWEHATDEQKVMLAVAYLGGTGK